MAEHIQTAFVTWANAKSEVVQMEALIRVRIETEEIQVKGPSVAMGTLYPFSMRGYKTNSNLKNTKGKLHEPLNKTKGRIIMSVFNFTCDTCHEAFGNLRQASSMPFSPVDC